MYLLFSNNVLVTWALYDRIRSANSGCTVVNLPISYTQFLIGNITQRYYTGSKDLVGDAGAACEGFLPLSLSTVKCCGPSSDGVAMQIIVIGV